MNAKSVPARRRTVFARPRNGFRDGPESADITNLTLANENLPEVRHYNPRLQPLSISDSWGANQQWLIQNNYSATQNNGNVLGQTETRFGATTWNQSYVYDGLNRLTQGTETNGWTQTYAYDRFGNRAVLSGSYTPGGSEATMTPEVATNTESAVLSAFPNNKWTGAVHDTAGNQQSIAGVLTGIQYDAEGHMTQVTNGSGATSNYAYDGEGRRVLRTTGGTTVQYVYDTNGELAAEYSNTAGSGGTKFPVEDHLGSIRGEINTAGTMEECYDYLPFGETVTDFGRTNACFTPPPTPDTAMKFTGKERDAESGLDYFGARYMSSAQGRFTSVDPIWVTKERILDPQRLNLYAYGRNNPIRYIDPDGMDITLGKCAVGGTHECFERLQQGLRQQDREHVHLVEGNGHNGFKKGEYGVTVDADYKSDSRNFQTLQKLAGDHSATATIDVLKGDERFDVKVVVNVNFKTGAETLGTGSLTPNEGGGFEGYTFYPYAKGVPGPYSTDGSTDVVVNADRGWIPSSIHHELRHVLLGDFGRAAPYGAHHTGKVDQETTEAEKEAVKNQLEVIRKPQ